VKMNCKSVHPGSIPGVASTLLPANPMTPACCP
jgi:hypothetical protein